MDHHLDLIYGDLDAPPTKPLTTSTTLPKTNTSNREEEKTTDTKPPTKESINTLSKQKQYHDHLTNKRKKKVLRKAAGKTWEDATLEEWPDNDYRIFCGDLGNEVSDDTLANAFKKYPSFVKARVVKDKVTMKSKGFGFVSIMN